MRRTVFGRNKFIHISSYGSMTGYRGGAAYNGYLYLPPFSTGAIIKTNLVTSTNLATGLAGYSSFILAQTGALYGFPQANTGLNKTIKILNDVVSYINMPTSLYYDGNLAPNGFVYAISRQVGKILKFNPLTDTYAEFGSFSNSLNNWRGSTLANNDCIYVAPFDAVNILKINTANDTVQLLGSLPSGGSKYWGAQLAPNGKVYFIPATATQIMVIDPATDVISFFGSVPAGSVFTSGRLGLDGKIYAFGTPGILIIDPNTNTCEIKRATRNGFMGSSLFDGKIIGFPSSTTGIGYFNSPTPNIMGSDAVVPANLADLPTSNYNKYYNKF